ncbi:hypothetical protein [Nannocystis bainbridge]|uniref:Outer membrane protein beta-barrel domain-containing protein n=1 Tax=Nannocystis bainbridge TaxID=2995303 RepID=A0ABT5DT01_9BACT|nr:hypothetical protein [Nannocystis bainbridge]MDC0716767.1 hypothetical protein [Nannocystis bainbridge]
MLAPFSLSLLLASAPAVAWQAPPECPTAADVRARLQTTVADVPRSAVTDFRARVTRVDAQTWRLETAARGEFGTTERPAVESGHCFELVDDFIHYADTVWRTWAVDEAPAKRRPALHVRLAGQVGLGLLPRGAFGGGQAILGVVWKHARLELGLAADGVDGLRLRPDDPAFRSDWVRGSLLVRGCGVLPTRRVDFLLCAGVEGGALAGRGGAAWNRAVPTFNVHAAPGLVWWFHRVVGLWLGASGGPLLPPLEPRGAGGSYGITRFFFAGGLGLEFRASQ